MPVLPAYGLYVLTDCENLTSQSLLRKTEAILDAGISLLQYRNKKDPANIKYAQAKELQSLCQRYKVPFIINDDLELAKSIHAEGLHLGKDDRAYQDARARLGDECIIGISCYNELSRASTAEEIGADYVAFGAFHPSLTKPEAVTASLDLLKLSRKKLRIPIVAIGGITPENAETLLQNGADFLAVSQTLYATSHPEKQVKKFNQLFRECHSND